MIDNAELTREVMELTRDVERLDSILDHQRRLLVQHAQDEEKAACEWGQIGTGIRLIAAKTREILDEIAQPTSRGGRRSVTPG